MSQGDKRWHAMSVADACGYWSTDSKNGLSTEEVRARLERHGPNALPEPPKPNPFLQFLGGFADPLVGALLVAAVVAAVVAITEGGSAPWYTRFSDTMAILLIVILNAVLGFLQERRAEQALDALQKMATPNAKAIRDGVVAILPAKALVPGDIVELEPGDAIPADVRVIESFDFQTEEAALTGESTPIEKTASAVLDQEAVLAERSNMAYLGTAVVRGRARALVVHTGLYTELGRIGAMIRAAERDETPLEQRLESLGKNILYICLALSTLLFVIGMIRQNQPWTVLLLTAVSLAVAAIPEGLPAITTITLALGMQRMAQRGAIVRKLPAVETLGSATVIGSDKTGTLTQNAMTVRIVETAEESFEVTGEGYSLDGRIVKNGSPVERTELLERLLTAATVCNGASVRRVGEDIRVAGDPTEAALVVLAMKGGISKRDALGDEAEVEREIPFDSDRKRMTVVVATRNGRVSYTKGSPDVLLPLCAHVRTKEGVRPLTDQARERLLRRNEELASQALRVLAIAERESPDSDPESALCFLGFAAMIDPPRSEAKQAVQEAERAGIQVVMITGDHKLTAIAIARELGFWHEGRSLAMTGTELEDLDEQKLTDEVHRIAVFARVTAEQKLRIVRALKRRGHVTAMTGDGVNDAPALREAQIGVAMGKAGTDVAREAADMVLADDNFATIVEAVREGRAIFRNIQKFIFFLNSSNAGLVVAVVIGSFFDWPQLTPLQLLWINLVTNGLPALALGVDPPDGSQMQEPPRPVSAGLIGWREVVGMVVVGIVMGGSALTMYALPDFAPHWLNAPNREIAFEEARAMAFTILAMSPLFHAFNCRSSTASIFRVGIFGNRVLWLGIAASATVHLVTIFVPALYPIFRTHALSGTEWLIVLVASVLPIPVVELLKAVLPAPRVENTAKPAR